MITLQERVHKAKPRDNWPLNKLHHVLTVRKGNKNKGMINDNLLSLSYGRIVNKNIDATGGLLPESFETYQIVQAGDIVMRLTDLQNDKRSIRQGLVKEKGIITSAYDAVYPKAGHDSRFWAYALLALDLAKYYYSLGGGVRQSIKFKDFPNDWIYTPPAEIQKEIADFLDQETARIDHLIAKKEQLIQTLKKQSNSVVTEGILQGHKDYNLQRHTEKDSQPDNLWPTGIKSQLFPLKLVCLPTKSLSDKTNPDMEISYIDIGNVSFLEGVKSITKYKFEDAPSRARQIIYPNDVIVSTVRTYLKAGAFIEDHDEENLICSTGFCVLRANDKILPRYLYRAVQSEPFISGVVIRSEGVSYPAVNSSRLLDLKIPLPSKEKQKKILDKIDRELSPIFEMIRKTKKSIDMIVEYKTSLITEAVTGQLDIEAWKNRNTVDRRLDKIEEEMAS